MSLFPCVDKPMSAQPRRFEYELPTAMQVEPGDTVWFKFRNGTWGVGEVQRAPCLEAGYRNGSYKIEITGGYSLWSDEIWKVVRPYRPGAWALE